VPAAASFLRHIPQPHASKQMTIIQPTGVKRVLNFLQAKLLYVERMIAIYDCHLF
jgi:hypothetical protein